MTFLDLQLAAKRKRDIRLGKIPALRNVYPPPTKDMAVAGGPNIADTAPFADETVEPVEVPGGYLPQLRSEIDQMITRLVEMRTEVALACAPDPTTLSTKTIALTVAKYFDLEFRDVLSPHRGRLVTDARQVAMYLAKEVGNKDFPAIGYVLQRDRTSVLHGWKLIAAKRKTDSQLDKDIVQLTALLLGEVAHVG